MAYHPKPTLLLNASWVRSSLARSSPSCLNASVLQHLQQPDCSGFVRWLQDNPRDKTISVTDVNPLGFFSKLADCDCSFSTAKTSAQVLHFCFETLPITVQLSVLFGGQLCH